MAMTDDIKDIKQTIKQHSDKLAKCRGSFQETDHDEIIRIDGVVKQHTKDIEKNVKTDKQHTDQLVELTGAINEVTDKVTNLASIELKRKNFFIAVMTGVLVLTIGAFIIWTAKLTVTQLSQIKTIEKTEKIDNKKLKDILVAFDGQGEIGNGYHERYIVDTEKFMKNLVT